MRGPISWPGAILFGLLLASMILLETDHWPVATALWGGFLLGGLFSILTEDERDAMARARKEGEGG